MGADRTIALPFSLVVSTVYGQMIVNRHDINQTNALFRGSKPKPSELCTVIMNQSVAGNFSGHQSFQKLLKRPAASWV